MTTTVHFVQHTHWDREWYFTTMDAITLSDQLFTEVLDQLEANPDNNFCLDGQTSIVDEYVDIHPEAQSRIHNLVERGQLFVGPWYTQTDALLPGAEALLRNLVIGIKDVKDRYGKPMMVGYLPDTFGFNAQLPTILAQAGIDNVIMWRGFNLEKQANSIYFNWQGLGDKSAVAANFPFGYSTAMLPASAKKELSDFVEKRYDPAVDFDLKHGADEDVLMPSGTDQLNIIHHVKDTLADINKLSKYHSVQSNYPAFMDKLRQKRSKLPSYQGNFRIPTYARVHRTIGMVRPEIKRETFLLEQKITRTIEPVTLIGAKAGVNVGNGLMIKLWKKLLECEPHDTLGGCVADNVAVDIHHRLKEANEIADGIENLIERKIADYLDLNENQIIIFNTDPYSFTGTKKLQVVASNPNFTIKGVSDVRIDSKTHFPARKNVRVITTDGEGTADEGEYFIYNLSAKVSLPPLGYQVFNIEESKTVLPDVVEVVKSESAQITSLGTTLAFDHGVLSLQTPTRLIKNVLQLIDEPNDGDTYDFSPLKGQSQTVLPLQAATVVDKGTHQALVVSGSAERPKALDEFAKQNPAMGTLSYKITLEFNDQNMIVGTINLDNEIKSHRLQLRFNPEIKSDTAIGEIQLGYQKTSNQSIPDDWEKQYVEKPVNVYCFDKSVSVSDNASHLTFWSVGQKNYQYQDGHLDITLMATTSQLGKANLAWRPGRASGDTTTKGHIMMPTPLAECMGQNQFDFAFQVADQPFEESANNLLTQAWLTPSISYQRQSLNYFIHRLDNKVWPTEDNPKLPLTESILDLGGKYSVSALYKSYKDPTAIIVRLENLTAHEVSVPAVLLDCGQCINAIEEDQAATDKIEPYDWVSFKIKSW